MSSITNIPINTRSMNGIITISDGTAILENGDLSGVDNLDANTSNINILTTTTQPVGTSNNSVATTQFVANGFVALTGTNNISSNNTFTGSNSFNTGILTAKTQLSTDNSTNVSTTEFVKIQEYAPLSGLNTFTNDNTFTNIITSQGGITSGGAITIKRASGDSSIIIQNNANLATNTIGISGVVSSYSQSGTSSGHSFFVRDSANINRNILNMTYANVTFTSSAPINTTASDPAVTNATGYLATTRFVNSKQTNFLTLANTWTNQQTLSRTAGNVNLRLLDSSNSSNCDFAVNNNQINIRQSLNDSKFIFNTNDTSGIQTDTLTINSTTTTLRTINPLDQPTAVMPSASDTSTKTPTCNWVQSAITNAISGITNFFNLSSNNTATGQNNFQNSGSNIPLTISTSSVANYVGNHFVSSGAGSYNPMVQANEYVIVGRDTSTLGNGTLTLTTHSGTSGGIKISGNGNTSTYGTHTFRSYIIPSTVSNPSLNNASLGYIYGQNALSFNPLWTGISPNQNLYTLNITASGSPLVFGTYLVNTCLLYFTSGVGATLAANWNQTGTTTLVNANMASVTPTSFFQDPPGTGLYYACVNFSFTIGVYGATTWFLNAYRTGGTNPQGFVSSAYFTWTRIA